MNRKLIKYDGTKTFMYPNGKLATPDKVLKDFPAIMHFAHLIETDENEEVLSAVMNLAQMRSMHNIDPQLNETEAIEALEVIINTPQEETDGVYVSPEERIAAALEFNNLLNI